MFCPNCGFKLPENSYKCWNCSTVLQSSIADEGSAEQPSLADAEPTWETCEIELVLSQFRVIAKPTYKFVAKATSPGGQYIAGQVVFDVKIMPGPGAHAKYLYGLKEVLELARWEQTELMGPHWYSLKFRRRLD